MIELKYHHDLQLDIPSTGNDKLLVAAAIRNGIRFYSFLPFLFPHMGLIVFHHPEAKFYRFCFRRFTLTYKKGMS